MTAEDVIDEIRAAINDMIEEANEDFKDSGLSMGDPYTRMLVYKIEAYQAVLESIDDVMASSDSGDQYSWCGEQIEEDNT